ncbi:hypothetical protein NM208_g16656 [Fusarium decemcellulare]|uniref:Uncharacterized protein n=1 Tax=Fusarium decemcellulare TaxID=57161 RepID=A0ACC1R9J8_9HYPO|nr:hypothetical protein NM208_g16656 [Fusarium decemcellulare]
MVFETKTGSQFHRVPKLQGAPDAIYYKHSTHPEPAPFYDHDETGIVLKGELWLEDEIGKKAILQPGDTFFIHRNSTVTFSTPRFAVAYKISARPSPHL